MIFLEIVAIIIMKDTIIEKEEKEIKTIIIKIKLIFNII